MEAQIELFEALCHDLASKVESGEAMTKQQSGEANIHSKLIEKLPQQIAVSDFKEKFLVQAKIFRVLGSSVAWWTILSYRGEGWIQVKGHCQLLCRISTCGLFVSRTWSY